MKKASETALDSAVRDAVRAINRFRARDGRRKMSDVEVVSLRRVLKKYGRDRRDADALVALLHFLGFEIRRMRS